MTEISGRARVVGRIAPLCAAGLLWGLGWFWVPPAWGVAVLILCVVLLAAASGLRGGRAGRIAASLALVATVVFVVDVLVLERDALQLVRFVAAVRHPPESFRLVDLNVLHGYPTFRDQAVRAELTVEALRALDPDVLVLQEAWRTRRDGDFVARLSEALGMDFAYARANGRLQRIGFEEGEAILSRFPILEASRIPLAPRRPFFERRVALICTLDLGDERLTVVGTHLDHRDLETASSQAATLARHLTRGEAPIVAGDLNAPSGSRAVQLFESLGFVDLVPGGIDHVLFAPGRSRWEVERASWTLRPAEVEGLTGARAEISDHPGIVVDFVRRVADR